jgi:hypothetical protein
MHTLALYGCSRDLPAGRPAWQRSSMWRRVASRSRDSRYRLPSVQCTSGPTATTMAHICTRKRSPSSPAPGNTIRARASMHICPVIFSVSIRYVLYGMYSGETPKQFSKHKRQLRDSIMQWSVYKYSLLINTELNAFV